jgi:hypothetical protein
VSPAHAALLARRRALIARSDAHRDEFSRALEEWKGPLVIADRVIGIAGSLRRYSPLFGVGVAVLLATRLKHVGKWIAYAQTIWKWTRKLR